MKIFNSTRMTQIQWICADYLFNPYGVNGHGGHLFYNNSCPTGKGTIVSHSPFLTND